MLALDFSAAYRGLPNLIGRFWYGYFYCFGLTWLYRIFIKPYGYRRSRAGF
jgi:hypothetical protein